MNWRQIIARTLFALARIAFRAHGMARRLAYEIERPTRAVHTGRSAPMEPVF